jgi:hypothetical protein
MGHGKAASAGSVLDYYRWLRCQLCTTAQGIDIPRSSAFRKKCLAGWEARNTHLHDFTIVQIGGGCNVKYQARDSGRRGRSGR